MEMDKNLIAPKEDLCIHCNCTLTKDNRAQWEDHCEDCETKVFKFYGACDEKVSRAEE